MKLFFIPNGCIAALLMSGACLSEVAANSDGLTSESGSIELDPIVVVASKIPRPMSEVAAQVTVIDTGDMASGMVEDLDGLLKYEPGLDLQTEGTRFGSSSINIRGVGGNRVAIEIDGIPVRDRFGIGAYSSGGRGIIELDRIKRVEVLYGPASVMYGSDALGGVVSISTWDPVDLLTGSDRDLWLGLRGGYQGSNGSWVGSAVTAWGQGEHGLLAAATWRNGHEMDNQAPADMPSDPQDWNSEDFLVRYTYDTERGDRLRFTAEQAGRDVLTAIHSQLGYGRRFRNTTALTGNDHEDNRRLSLDFDFAVGGWRQGTLRVFNVRQTTDQRTFEERAKGAAPVDIMRRFRYRQTVSGAELNLFRDVSWGNVLHRIATGAEWKSKDISESRDGLETSLLDGSSTRVILGEDMPVRDFPNSRTDEYSLYLQDEISLSEGIWQLIPAVRWDRYELEPRPDTLWLEDNPETPVVSVHETELTPRLGLLFHPREHWTLYAQYSRGFRAPPFEDANIGFDIPLFGYRAIPNPDLKSESSEGLETGLRISARDWRFSLSAFHTDFDDFIESRALIGLEPETGDLIFQSRNIDTARIRGLDLRFEQSLAVWHEAMENWMLNLAGYWAEGVNSQSKAPLNSIAPPQAVLGVSWLSPDGAWDFAANTTLTATKKTSDIDETAGERFATPSWITFDLTAGWRPSARLELRAGVFNLSDRTYWRWLDVANREADDPMISLLSRPGRNVSLTAQFSY